MKKLSLRREVVTELTADELTGVRGAAGVPTLPVDDCVSIQECPWTENLRCITSHTCH